MIVWWALTAVLIYLAGSVIAFEIGYLRGYYKGIDETVRRFFE